TSDCDDEYWQGYDMGCDQSLEEVMVVSHPKYVVELQEVFYTGGTEGQDYYYSVENSAAGAGGGSSPYDSNNDGEAVKVENELDDPCAKEIFNQLNQGLLDLNSLILNFFNHHGSFDLLIKDENLRQPANGTLNARTTTERGRVIITLDND